MKKIFFLLLIMIVFCTGADASSLPYIDKEEQFNQTLEDMSAGNFSFDPARLAEGFFDALLSEVRKNTGLLISFFTVGAVSAVVNLLEFKDKGVREASFFGCFSLCAATAIACFSNILEYAVSVTDAMGDFITKLAPILTGLLLTSARPASAGVFHPVLAAAVYMVTVIVKKCIIPLSVYAAILGVASNISDQVQISGFCKLISSVSKWILAASFTLFTGICGIYGFSAPALDVMSAKTVKFAVGSLVPVVGGFLSETLETVVSGSRMMKNAVGSAGLVALCGICIVPVIKIGVMLFTLKVAAAVIEPITDRRIARLLSDIADAAAIVFGMTITVAVLFIICISIILAATN